MKDKTNTKLVMIGSGQHSIFVRKNINDKHMLSDGTIVRVKQQQTIDQKLEDICKKHKTLIKRKK